MRLIDADKIKYTSIAHLASYPVAPSPCDTVMRAEINAMPTVDAIPIEWLKEHYPTKQVYGTEQYFRTAYAVQDILAEWERAREEE